MVSVQVNGKLRTDVGKSAVKAVRREGNIPAVLYGGEEVINFHTTLKEVKELVYTPEFKVAEVNIDGKGSFRCIVKEVQFHPVRENIMHMDFLRLEEGNPVKVDVPLRTKGIAAGVKEGGKLQQLVRRIKIKTTPEHLVDELFVDVSGLTMNESARIRDIETTDKIEVLMSPSIPIAAVIVPRALRSATAAEELEEALLEGGGEVEEGAEGEAPAEE